MLGRVRRTINVRSTSGSCSGALELARASLGLASPNPQVGCVVVRDGQIVGEGAHIYDERDHAEIVALRHARECGADLSGATAYVTLEPCSHHGRTGPCADALIAARVRRVVVATVDPNPQVGGKGIARLRAAGIDAAVEVLQPEARAINDAFARFIRAGRPLVTLKAALSADGMLAPPASARIGKQPHWLTGAESRAEVQRMRHSADALLTGIGTVLADDPLLTDCSGLPRRRPLLRVVIDSRLRTPLDSQLVRSARGDLLIFYGTHAEPARAAALQAAGVEVVQLAPHSGRVADKLERTGAAARPSRSRRRARGPRIAPNHLRPAGVRLQAERRLPRAESCGQSCALPCAGEAGRRRTSICHGIWPTVSAGAIAEGNCAD